MLNFINLFFINFLFAHADADDLRVWAFPRNPKRFDWWHYG